MLHYKAESSPTTRSDNAMIRKKEHLSLSCSYVRLSLRQAFLFYRKRNIMFLWFKSEQTNK
jgi:hypothetical protein